MGSSRSIYGAGDERRYPQRPDRKRLSVDRVIPVAPAEAPQSTFPRTDQFLKSLLEGPYLAGRGLGEIVRQVREGTLDPKSFNLKNGNAAEALIEIGKHVVEQEEASVLRSDVPSELATVIYEDYGDENLQALAKAAVETAVAEMRPGPETPPAPPGNWQRTPYDTH